MALHAPRDARSHVLRRIGLTVACIATALACVLGAATVSFFAAALLAPVAPRYPIGPLVWLMALLGFVLAFRAMPRWRVRLWVSILTVLLMVALAPRVG